MGDSTAKDKLRVAWELARRPLLAAAFAAGAVSYCKIRALTRITDADEETDTALLAAAAKHTVAELEQVVRHWELLHQQENPTRAMKRWNRRGMRRANGFGGISTLEITQLTEE